jgi:alpha-D-ribose 1-methylphosphonate 5-triphosphate synthase subunit PhnL
LSSQFLDVFFTTFFFEKNCSQRISWRLKPGMTSAKSQQQFNSPTELHVDFKIAYMYEYITKLCKTQAEVILNHVNPNVHGIGKG